MKTATTNPTRKPVPAHKPATKVRMEHVNAAARSVCVAGTFNDWHPGVTEMLNLGNGRWVKELALSPGRHEYRLVVDGAWLADPNCRESVPNPYQGQNSLLLVLPPP